MTDSPSKNRERERYTFTLPPKVMESFRIACGLIPASRQIEELMKGWLRTRTGQQLGKGVSSHQGTVEPAPDHEEENRYHRKKAG